MATVQEIYNEIDRIDNAKSGIAGAIEEKGVEVPAGAKIDEYPELVRQIQQGDTSDCVKFTPQTLTEEQKAQARENIGAGSGGGDGKMGVISQTQTWSGTGSNPRTYVMSNQVTGLIPQANIDLFEAAGAVFNATTGYFELNGLTDISYEEMQDIYYKSIGMVPIAISRSTQGVGYSARATLPMMATSSYQTNISYWFYNALVEHINIENSSLVHVNVAGSGTTAFQGCLYLRSINGRMKLSATSSYSNIFTGCVSLETVSITSLSSNISFAQSPNLTAASVAYMITNAGTATITITLHATAYARAIADASVQAALQTKTNVSLASA